MNFETALKVAVKKLRAAKAKGLVDDFIVIGDLALARVGTVRSTGDIDFAIKLDNNSLHALAHELVGVAREGDAYDPLLGCVNFMTGSGASTVNVQLIRFPKAIEEAAFSGVEKQVVDGTEVPFISWNGLLILKLYAGSPLDMQDAQSLFDQNTCTEEEYAELRRITGKLRLSKRLAKLKR